jgi:hypothetical protein
MKLSIRVAAGAAIAAAVLVGAGAAFNPFGASVSERVSAEVDADASCRKAGLEMLAGERESVYTCTYRAPTLEGHPYTSNCFALVDGDVYAVRVDRC